MHIFTLWNKLCEAGNCSTIYQSISAQGDVPLVVVFSHGSTQLFKYVDF